MFPETSEQRCWFHKLGNFLAALPKSAQPGAKKALAEICNAEDKTHALAAAKVFAAEFGVKWPKAAAKITDDLDVLLAFYDYPAEHWVHLRTSNPIESTFAPPQPDGRSTPGATTRRRPAAPGLTPATRHPNRSQLHRRRSNQHTQGRPEDSPTPQAHAGCRTTTSSSVSRWSFHLRHGHRVAERPPSGRPSGCGNLALGRSQPSCPSDRRAWEGCARPTGPPTTVSQDVSTTLHPGWPNLEVGVQEGYAFFAGRGADGMVPAV